MDWIRVSRSVVSASDLIGNGGAMASRGWYGVVSVFVYKNASPVGEFEADFGSQDQLGVDWGAPPFCPPRSPSP